MIAAPSKRVVAIGLAVFLVAFFTVWAVARGLADPEVPSGDVAVVEDVPGGPITREDFDQALQQAAAAQGGGDVPEEDDPQYEAIKEQALSDLILARWVRGEAEERGITVADSEVEQRLEEIKEQNFDNEREFKRFLRQSGFSQEDAVERVRLTQLSTRIQEAVLTGEDDVSEGQIEDFYEENRTQFEQPESRDVRVIQNQQREQVERARQQLEDDDSKRSWNKVAERFSEDDTSKESGGLRSGVVEGQGDPAFDEQVFGAEQEELVGPFETEEGFYLIQVDTVNEAQTTSLEEASEQIGQQLASAQQQEAASLFETAFVDKWTARTFCAEDFIVEQCANAPPPPSPEGAAPVQSVNPAAPGGAGSVTPGVVQGGAPQGPIPAQTEQAEGEVLPPDAAPIGPPGAAPPGGAPPQGAPPQGAPPQGAPPQGP